MIRLRLIWTFLNIDRTNTTDWWTRFFHNPIYHIKLYNQSATAFIKFSDMMEKCIPDMDYGRFQAHGLEDTND